MSPTKKRPESALQGRFLSWVEWLSELEAQTGQGNTLLADTELGKTAQVCAAGFNTDQ